MVWHHHAGFQHRISNNSFGDNTFDEHFLSGRNYEKDITTDVFRDTSVATLIMGVIGLPGNLFVIAVYVCNMTISTRVYMFALAVADALVCICGIGLGLVECKFIVYGTIMHVAYTSVSFSLSLLTFVSIERLLAVRRPHKFNRSPLRAKRAIGVLVVTATVMATVMTVSRVKHYELVLKIFPTTFTVMYVTIMIVCYSLVALTLLVNLRAAHRKVAVASKTQAPSCSTVPDVRIAPATTDVASAHTIAASTTKKTTIKHSNTYKGLSVLFVVSLVVLLCLTPRWLSSVGFNVPIYMHQMFFLNSVLNPFIYSAVSSMFREDVRQFYRQMRIRLTACHH